MENERKKEHLENFLKSNFKSSNLLENVYIEHFALTDLNFDEIDTSVDFLGKKLSFPLLINAITGGAESSYDINEDLARLCKHFNIAFVSGSQKVALQDEELVESFTVINDILDNKDVIISNLSALSSLEDAKRAVEMLKSDAISLHLNPAQEIVQFEGDRNFSGILKNIENIASEIKIFENKLNELKTSYNEYIKNNVLAKDLENLLLKVEKSIKELYSLRFNKNSLKEKVFSLEDKIKNIKIDELREKYDILKEELNEISKKLGSSQEKIENFKKILEKIASQEEKQKKLLDELKKLEDKSNRANLIRNEVGKMGRAISKYMLSGISNIASLNFNKITGRTERIEWSNDEKDKYVLYLVGQERKIAFEQLSGGEQVSVAIAIRGTMTEYFTNSRFMILDEPTNNLDTERKKLLAEYMGEILKNLDQSIIVTHDDTFREMAEKIIEL